MKGWSETLDQKSNMRSIAILSRLLQSEAPDEAVKSLPFVIFYA